MQSKTSNGRPEDIEAPALPPLIPPFRFALVQEGIYRGAHPSLRNLRYLTRLELRMVVSLLPEEDRAARDLSEFCVASGINHVTHTLAKYDDGFAHTPQLVARVLEQLLDAANHPVFIHCMDGRQNTGIVIMCLRKLQNWGLPAILDEFARYTKDNSFEYAEQTFVQNFNPDLQLPRIVPDWFRGRVRLVESNKTQEDLEKDRTPNHTI